MGAYFCSRHFDIYFIEWELLYVNSNFTDIFAQGFIEQ